MSHNAERLDALSVYVSTVYAVEREVGEGYEYLLNLTVRQFSRFLARDAILADLTDTQVSLWLKHLQDAEHLSARTIAGRRGDLLAIWRHAYEAGHVQQGPARVRKIRVPEPVPVAWTLDELERILTQCRKLRGYLGNGLPRAEYFWTKFKAAYETGLRRGDLWLLSTAHVRDDGRVVITQHKTRHGHVAQMRPDTLHAFRELAARLRRNGEKHAETPLRWPHYPRAFYFWVGKIRVDANVSNEGALHRCRKSGATYAHKQDRINGAALYLGQTQPGYADRFYIDRSIANGEPFLPPDISPRTDT